MKKVLLPALFILLHALCAAQPAAGVRVIFFSDKTVINDSLQNAFQNVLKSSPQYKLENVEKRPALFSGNSYILNPPQDFEEDLLSSADYYYRSAGVKDIITAQGSLMLQQPYFDKNIRDAILQNGEDAAALQARSAVMTLRDGPALDIISTETFRPNAEWVPGVSVNYYLRNSEGASTVTIFDRPAGGIGAWYDALQKIIRAEAVKPIIVNTGGIDGYENIIPPDFLPQYWEAVGADIVAPGPRDIDAVWAVSAAGLETPRILATNISAVDDSVKNPFNEIMFIERGGAKIGFISLAEENSLDSAPGRGIPLKTREPSSAAKAALEKLRGREKADFIVLVSHLDYRTLTRVLQSNPGIDMVINSRPQSAASAQRSRVELTDWNKEQHYIPAYMSHNNVYTLGDVKINFARNNRGLTPAVIEDLPPTDIFAGNTFANSFYAVNKELFTASAKQGAAVLPGALRLSAAYGKENYISYTPLEFFNMAAAIILKKTGAEAAFIKIQPFAQQFFGAITAAEAAQWLGADEDIITAKLTGAELKKMLQFADFTQPFGGSNKDYSAGLRFIAAGVEENGGKYRVNGLNIVDDEIYSVAFPASLTRERFALPFLQSGLSAKEAGIKLHAAVINHLSELKDKTAQAAHEMFEAYKQNYDTRRASNMPPRNELEEELDLKLETMGPLAVEAYFLDEMQGKYLRQISALVANKPQITAMWRVNLKNLSLQISDTEVRNADLYNNSSLSRLKADSQTLIQGNLNLTLEYYKDRIRWDNTVFMEYGRMSIRPANRDSYTSESADRIVLSTDYTYKAFDVKNFAGGFLAGPFLSLSYNTEFTEPAGKPRYRALRGRGGLRLFEGKYLKELYIAVAPELDFTYPAVVNNYAWECGIKAEHPVNDKAKAIYRAMTRNYFINRNAPLGNDLSYEFELDARLQMEIFRKFSIAPFATYYQAQSKTIDKPGTNLYVGVAISYSRLFKNFPF